MSISVFPLILGCNLYSYGVALLEFQWKVWGVYQIFLTHRIWTQTLSPCHEEKLKFLLMSFSFQAVVFPRLCGVFSPSFVQLQNQPRIGESRCIFSYCSLFDFFLSETVPIWILSILVIPNFLDSSDPRDWLLAWVHDPLLICVYKNSEIWRQFKMTKHKIGFGNVFFPSYVPHSIGSRVFEDKANKIILDH